MLPSIDTDALEGVSGGQNTTTVQKPNGEVRTSTRSDYAYCTDKVAEACNKSNPGWLWGTDTVKAGQCVRESLPQACGLPPNPSSSQ